MFVVVHDNERDLGVHLVADPARFDICRDWLLQGDQVYHEFDVHLLDQFLETP